MSSSFCHVAVSILSLFLAMSWVGVQYVIVAFPGHTHLLLPTKHVDNTLKTGPHCHINIFISHP